MGGRAVGPDHLSNLAGLQATDDRRAGEKRQHERRHRSSSGTEADVVEEIKDDVRAAERSEPMIEHEASAALVCTIEQVRKYTFERHTAGCLEEHELIPSQPLGESRPKRIGVGSGHEP